VDERGGVVVAGEALDLAVVVVLQQRDAAVDDLAAAAQVTGAGLLELAEAVGVD
jgi:hypothetical protein